MTELAQVPAVKFDPTRHVIAGRDAKTGVQRFFALSEIVAAEKEIETVSEPQASAPPEISKQDLAALESRVMAELANIPPATFPADMMQTFAAITQTAVALAKRVEKLEAANEVFTQNFVQFKAMTGVGA